MGNGTSAVWTGAKVRFLALLSTAALLGCLPGNVERLREREVAEARAAFEANLAAIRSRDLDAYLAGYLDSPDFVYLGPAGVARGFAAFAAARRAQVDFPDSLVAGTPELTWVAPGVVHVAYPFAARQGVVTGAGWSERVFVRTADGWRIAVTSVIPTTGDDAPDRP
jgi:ketosteroid isomerase-like protein